MHSLKDFGELDMIRDFLLLGVRNVSFPENFACVLDE